MIKRKNNIAGFTLIELSIVIIAVGLLMIPLANLYTTYLNGKDLQVTKDNILESNNSVSGYKQVLLNQHYPCPSDRSLPPGDPNYGREFNNGNCTLAQLEAVLGTLGVAPRCTPTGGFCMILGARDTAADADTVFDPILIGGIPIVSIKELIASNDSTIPLPPNTSVLDGYGNQITYAVSQTQVDATLFDSQNGVLAVIDENNIPTGGINNNANYVLLSHGQDGKGAFSREGTLHSACAGITAKDGENCNNDATFMQVLGLFKGNGATYYDDSLYIGKSGSSELWRTIYDSSGNNTGKIFNLNDGNIGIKTSTPQTKLDVAGTARVDNTAQATQLCKTDGTMCFDIDAITSSGKIRCTSGSSVMRGINSATADCFTPAFAPVQDIDCGTGWVSGIQANGSPICTP